MPGGEGMFLFVLVDGWGQLVGTLATRFLVT
jgi:flagellar biosynthesis protein FliP